MAPSQIPFWFSTIFFLFTFLFSLFSLLIFLLRLKFGCCCEICQSLLTSSWTKEFENLSDYYTHLLRKSRTGTIHIHVLRNVITANPANVEHMLKIKFQNYPKGKPFSVILGDLLGKGIFNVDGDSWKFQRKMASLELGSVSIRQYLFEIVQEEIHTRLIPALSSFSNLTFLNRCETKTESGSPKSDDAALDIQDIFQRFSFDNICKFSFGIDPECLTLPLPSSKLAMAFDLASKLSAERAMAASPIVWKAKRLLNVGSEKRLKEAIKTVHELAEEVIHHRREKGFSDKNDLLSRFMGSIDDDKYLRDIVISFLLAGRDTVASGLTSFFYLLSKHPEVELAIRAEMNRVLGPSQNLEAYESIKELHYLNAALHESMRLFPPVQFDSKFAQNDDVLADGTLIQSGTRVTYHPYAMGRMEQVWGSDSVEFKPERWMQDGKFVQENAFKYPVFQAGLRVCLGKEMALVEMKCVAAALIRQFNIRVADPIQAPKFAPGLTATVRGGLRVIVEERGVN